MQLILRIATAAILGFSGLAPANAPASRIIDTGISADVAAPLAATQARGEKPLRMAPNCATCNKRGQTEPLLMAPGCPSCTRGGKEPLRMAPTCSGTRCGLKRAEPVLVAPNCAGCVRDKLS